MIDEDADRNAQFEYINAKVIVAQAKGQPVISVDTSFGIGKVARMIGLGTLSA